MNASDEEKHSGLFFVALTRVRHPEHIAFDPFPSIERVTSEINKPALRARMMHEQQLRQKAAATKARRARAARA